VALDPRTHTPSSDDTSHHNALSQFRRQVKQAKQEHAVGWELTRKLVEPRSLPATLEQLTERIHQSTCQPAIQEMLLAALPSPGSTSSKLNVHADRLKELTGLPATKAIRVLCLYFNLVDQESQRDDTFDPQELEDFVRTHTNPYDWLLKVDDPSLLDLGAGDLSFEETLLDQYFPQVQKAGQLLTLHALDRLQPGSQFGGVYHANQERLTRFSQYPSQHLHFRFWGAKDMLDLTTPRELRKTYSIVTCHAPATPTFAFEPTRLSQNTIQAHLKRTKGDFKTVRVNGEEALEVHHRGRTLTFPSWKFAIRGPLPLLDLMARRGQLCILSAIDAEVFWEILAQLVEDESMRPSNVVFTQENLPEIFKQVYESLSSLKEGERCSLSNVTPLRTQLPHPLTPHPRGLEGFRFRYIEVRRGAVFSDMPASFTARQFSQMSEELPPWYLILIPELLVS
jgi:hypothetical protein